MAMTNVIVKDRRFLKRRNYSPHTLKNYMNIIKHFVLWVNVPIEAVDRHKMAEYTDHLLYKRLKPKTINCHLACIRVFYDYLHHEEGVELHNPIRKGSALRMPKPLPKHLRDEEVVVLFDSIQKPRDRAMFKIMLRCGLRVDEVANLRLSDLDLKRNRIFVRNGKGRKERVAYVSQDTYAAIVAYFKVLPSSPTAKKIFLVEKGPYSGRPLSVRGIKKRIEHYSRITGIRVSSHHLRHTMATQMLNADAEVVTIQDLLGHNQINTTERYCSVSNIKVMKDYFKAMEVIMQKNSTRSSFLPEKQLDRNHSMRENKSI